MSLPASVKWQCVVYASVLTLWGCGGNDASQGSSLQVVGAVVQDGVSCSIEMMPARDGTKLYTEVYKPNAAGKYPVVLIRNPYGYLLGDGCFASYYGQQGLDFAKSGYAVMVQEVRGTKNSEGTMTPFFQEQDDGYDAVQWAATQSWSNGNVGMTASSYLGEVQWQAAVTAPPNLRAFTPNVAPTDLHDDWVARNGVFDLQFARQWGVGFVPDALTRMLKAQGLADEQIQAQVQAWTASNTANNGWASALPLTSTWDATARELAPWVWEWQAHPTYDAYWAKIDVQRQLPQVAVPALISGGWYDLFASGTVDSFTGMKQLGGSEAAVNGTMLVMDCCGHGYNFAPVAGETTWGPDKTQRVQLERAFLDKYVMGLDNGVEIEPRVQLTVLVPPDSGTTGDNFVLKVDAYPVPGTQYVAYNLGSGGSANTSSGDGVLSAASAPKEPPDTFTYDPLNPVPTVGGNATTKALDQSQVEQRDDVLVYTSAPLTEDLAVIGPVSIQLWAQTSASDTDFTAKLVDVHPDGYAHNVIDRIVRARYRNGSKSVADPIIPNVPYSYEFRVGNTATMFKAGHRIRLEISSSNFPHYQRNLNTGDSNESTSVTVQALQTIFHDDAHPSALVLPIVPGVKIPSQ